MREPGLEPLQPLAPLDRVLEESLHAVPTPLGVVDGDADPGLDAVAPRATIREAVRGEVSTSEANGSNTSHSMIITRRWRNNCGHFAKNRSAYPDARLVGLQRVGLQLGGPIRLQEGGTPSFCRGSASDRPRLNSPGRREHLMQGTAGHRAKIPTFLEARRERWQAIRRRLEWHPPDALPELRHLAAKPPAGETL